MKKEEHANQAHQAKRSCIHLHAWTSRGLPRHYLDGACGTGTTIRVDASLVQLNKSFQRDSTTFYSRCIFTVTLTSNGHENGERQDLWENGTLPITHSRLAQIGLRRFLRRGSVDLDQPQIAHHRLDPRLVRPPPVDALEPLCGGIVVEKTPDLVNDHALDARPRVEQ